MRTLLFIFIYVFCIFVLNCCCWTAARRTRDDIKRIIYYDDGDEFVMNLIIKNIPKSVTKYEVLQLRTNKDIIGQKHEIIVRNNIDTSTVNVPIAMPNLNSADNCTIYVQLSTPTTVCGLRLVTSLLRMEYKKGYKDETCLYNPCNEFLTWDNKCSETLNLIPSPPPEDVLYYNDGESIAYDCSGEHLWRWERLVWYIRDGQADQSNEEVSLREYAYTYTTTTNTTVRFKKTLSVEDNNTMILCGVTRYRNDNMNVPMSKSITFIMNNAHILDTEVHRRLSSSSSPSPPPPSSSSSSSEIIIILIGCAAVLLAVILLMVAYIYRRKHKKKENLVVVYAEVQIATSNNTRRAVTEQPTAYAQIIGILTKEKSEQ